MSERIEPMEIRAIGGPADGKTMTLPAGERTLPVRARNGSAATGWAIEYHLTPTPIGAFLVAETHELRIVTRAVYVSTEALTAPGGVSVLDDERSQTVAAARKANPALSLVAVGTTESEYTLADNGVYYRIVVVLAGERTRDA